MTMIANYQRDHEKVQKAFELTDFIRLSFDDKEVQKESVPDDAFEQITKKWGKTLDGSK